MASTYLTLSPSGNKISHVWKTGIQTTINGIEKRSALYTFPRVNSYHEFIAYTTPMINFLKRKLFYYPDTIWGIPIWMDKTLVTSQASSGQKTIHVAETDYRHFNAGGKFLLVSSSDFTSYEVGTIDSMSSTQIVAVGYLTSTWPINTMIFPLYDCRVNQSQEMEADFELAQYFHLDAREEFESLKTFLYSAPSSGADTYQDLDLFLNRMTPTVTYGYKRPYNLVQYLGLGYAYQQYAPGDNALGLKASILMTEREEIYNLFKFFDSKMGRFDKFWVPTWSKDLVPNAGILASDTVISVEPIEYNTIYFPNEVIDRHVLIRFPGGSYACRKILGANATTITLDSVIGTSVLAADLNDLIICFLILGRFDIDELEVEYIKENIATAELSFAGLVGEDIT